MGDAITLDSLSIYHPLKQTIGWLTGSVAVLPDQTGWKVPWNSRVLRSR